MIDCVIIVMTLPVFDFVHVIIRIISQYRQR